MQIDDIFHTITPFFFFFFVRKKREKWLLLLLVKIKVGAPQLA